MTIRGVCAEGYEHGPPATCRRARAARRSPAGSRPRASSPPCWVPCSRGPRGPRRRSSSTIVWAARTGLTRSRRKARAARRATARRWRRAAVAGGRRAAAWDKRRGAAGRAGRVRAAARTAWRGAAVRACRAGTTPPTSRYPTKSARTRPPSDALR